MVEIIKNSIRFITLVFLQTVVFNNIDISIFLSPMIFVLFIILLPFSTPKWLLLASSFSIGLIIDIFMNTPGILSFSAVMIAYIRPLILNLIKPRDGYPIGVLPRVKDLAWPWFLQYSIMLTVLFHLTYFIILGFFQENFLLTLWKTIISSSLIMVMVLLSQLFFNKK